MEITTLFSTKRYEPEVPLDILVLSPHPDDAEICCGGVIAKLVHAGHSIGVADFSRGEMGSRGTVEGRMEESREASKILGIDVRFNLGFPDSQIGVKDKERQQEVLVSLLRAAKPKTIFCPYGDKRNPDHFNARSLVEDSLFYANLLKKFPSEGAPHLVSTVIYYMMRQTFEPSFVTDITDFIDIKRNSIKAHKSQVGLEGTGHDTLVSSPLLLSSLEARDGFYGGMAGVAYAEPFFMKGPISMDDPHKFLSNVKTNKAFFCSR